MDPESSIRGGSTNTGVLRGGGSKYHYKRAIINPPALGHLNDVSLACRLWPNIECWLGRLVIVQGVRTSIAKKYYMFVVFQGGGGGSDPLIPSLGPSMSYLPQHNRYMRLRLFPRSNFLYPC